MEECHFQFALILRESVSVPLSVAGSRFRFKQFGVMLTLTLLSFIMDIASSTDQALEAHEANQPQSHLLSRFQEIGNDDEPQSDWMRRFQGWNQMEDARRTSAVLELMHRNINSTRDSMQPWTQFLNEIGNSYRMTMLTLLKAMAGLPREKFSAMRAEEKAAWKAMTEPQRKQFQAIVTIATVEMSEAERHDFAVFIAKTYDHEYHCDIYDDRVCSDWFDAEMRYLIAMGWDNDQARLVMDKVRMIRGVFKREPPKKKSSSGCMVPGCCCG